MSAAGRGWRRVLPAMLGIALSVALLLWALRGVRLGDIGRQIEAAHTLPLLAAIVVATLTFPLRLVRWRLLLRDETGGPLPAAALWHAVSIGFMANNLLPFRAGELVRILTVTRLAGSRFSAAISSLVVERIFDGLTVVAMLSYALLVSDLPSGVAVAGVSVARLAQGAGTLSLLALVGALAVVAFPLAAERLVRRVAPARLAGRVVRFIEGIRHGMAVLRAPARLAGVVGWSVVLWGVNALAFYICFAAFDIPVGYAGALLLQGLLVLGIALPSTPGFIGPFEAAIVAALALYGIPNAVAFSYAITFHVTTFVPILLLGAWSLARTPVELGDLRRPSA